MHHILYWYVTRSEYRLRENEYNMEQYDSPAILHMHLLFAKPNPVFILQLFPLQYWQTGLQLKGVAVHWPLWHVSARVHGLPSSHATLSRLDHVLVLLLGLHHWKKHNKILESYPQVTISLISDCCDEIPLHERGTSLSTFDFVAQLEEGLL